MLLVQSSDLVTKVVLPFPTLILRKTRVNQEKDTESRSQQARHCDLRSKDKLLRYLLLLYVNVYPFIGIYCVVVFTYVSGRSINPLTKCNHRI